MLQGNLLKIMELFFEEPSRSFQLREISRLTKIAPTSVKRYLQELLKQVLIKKIKGNIYPSYIANQESRLYRLHKQQTIIKKLYSSGLIDFLEDNLHPPCIILFGSAREGEHVKNSDVDMFVQTKEKRISLKHYEKILKHKINIFFEDDLNRLSKELFNNIINGIKLSGYLKIR
ncbi:MAG: nucleotidyltransferase domain-containing protein [Nanoarchaeota archaeon]|nr:nucleotidyltransferase domain-containing protein [Nanoarchaeota archaeon]